MEITIIRIYKKNFSKKKVDKEEHPIYQIEILQAYSIAYTQIIDGSTPYIENGNYTIDRNKNLLEITYPYESFIEEDPYLARFIELYVYYYGIKDYSLLFPKIKRYDPQFAIILGNYYHEAEVAFREECWTSFSLLCGAIYEGILVFKYENDVKKIRAKLNKNEKDNIDFFVYIEYAKKIHDIDSKQAKIINETRKSRNNIHPQKLKSNLERKEKTEISNYGEYSRTNAMNIMETLDYMLKNFIY